MIIRQTAIEGLLEIEPAVFGDARGYFLESFRADKLREAGVIRVEPVGTKRIVTLRRTDLDSRFPGFLDSVIMGARGLPFAVRDGETLIGAEASAAGPRWNDWQRK